MEKETEAIIKEHLRTIQKKASKINEALEKREHEETKARIKARKALFKKQRLEAIRKAEDNGVPPEDTALILDSQQRKSVAEIIAKGTARERAELVIDDFDSKGYFKDRILSEGEKTRLQAAVARSSAEDRTEFYFYVNEYDNVCKLAYNLRYDFKILQIQLSIISQLCTEWKGYESKAKLCTDLVLNDEEIGGKGRLTNEGKEHCLIEIANRLNKSGDRVTYSYDKEKKQIVVDVDEESGLFSALKHEAADGIKYMSIFKGTATAIQDYCIDIDLPVFPLVISIAIDNAEEENYIRSLQPDLRYFQSNLETRRLKGGIITQEDEQHALIPSYHGVEADPKRYKFIINKLND